MVSITFKLLIFGFQLTIDQEDPEFCGITQAYITVEAYVSEGATLKVWPCNVDEWQGCYFNHTNKVSLVTEKHSVVTEEKVWHISCQLHSTTQNYIKLFFFARNKNVFKRKALLVPNYRTLFSILATTGHIVGLFVGEF